MTARVKAERAIADVLAEHEFIPCYAGAVSGRCKACHPPHLDNMMGTAVHRAHVASVLADLMAEKQAEAWDEGYATGSTDCARFLGWATSEVPDARPKDRANPHRPDPKDTRDE